MSEQNKDVPVQAVPLPVRPRLIDHVLIGNAIESIPETSPLVEGVLDFDSTALVYGASGVGKSFGILDLALCVASGHAWHGHVTLPGPVVFVVGEGLSGTRTRYQAWRQLHEVEDVPEIVFLPTAPNILTHPGRSELFEVVEKHRPVLTVLDTVARCIPGGDENSFESMSLVVMTLDTIRTMTGGCALGVHHPGKDESAGARGHSSLKGAMDTEINVTKGPTFIATKQKNHGDGHIIETFELVPLGPSMILQSKKRKTTPNDTLMIDSLNALGGEARYAEWRDLAVQMGVPRGSFDRCRQRLIEAMVVTDGTDGDGYHRFV